MAGTLQPGVSPLGNCGSPSTKSTAAHAPLMEMYGSTMRASGWHNGGPKDSAGGYGLKFTEDDRDRHFDRSWSEVLIEMDGGGLATVRISPSFWRHCSELRSPEIGRWLLGTKVAPWPKGNPPSIGLQVVDANRFAARILPKITFPDRAG